MILDDPDTPHFFAPEHLSAPFMIRCTVEGQVLFSALATRDLLVCAHLQIERPGGDLLSCLAYCHPAQIRQVESLANRSVRLFGELFDYAMPGATWRRLVLRVLSAAVPGAPILLFQRVGNPYPAPSGCAERPR